MRKRRTTADEVEAGLQAERDAADELSRRLDHVGGERDPGLFGAPPLLEGAAPAHRPAWRMVVELWIELWRERETRAGRRLPGAPRRAPATAPEAVERALRRWTVDEVSAVLRWAFRAPDFGAAHLRGETDGGTVYLGLDNLLRSTKIAGRLELARAWEEGGSRSAAPARGGYAPHRPTSADVDVDDWDRGR